MLKKVRKLLRDRSPDWLNTEVNKNLLQNLSANINCSPRPNLGEGLGVRADIQPASKRSISPNSDYIARSQSDRSISTENCLQFPTPGTPHWRRIKQVFQALDNAPFDASYNQLIEYVRETTGVGCSRKLISKWKKYRQNSDLLLPKHDLSNGNGSEINIVSTSRAIALGEASPVPCNQTIERELSTVNCFQLNQLEDNSSNNDSLNRPNLLPVKTWSYLAAAGIMVSLVGCEIIPFNNHPSENVAIASVTAPITPLTPIPERRKNRLEPRNIKIELTLSNPQDLKVKPGDKISAGQILSDRVSERNRLQAKKKQLQLSLEKLNLPLTPIPQPRTIPEIRPLPPVSYAEAEAAIKLKQQKLTEAERAIALQQKKIDSLTQLRAFPSHRSKGGGDIKLILEHEQANLANLEAARQSAQIQLEVAQSKLTTAKERRAYIEYQRQLEQTRRAIAIEQQHQAIQRQKSERERLLAEREYSQAQIETQIQTLDYQIHQLSTVRAPYEGTIKKVKWTGQSDHHLTAVITLAVNDNRPTVANSTSKPIPDREAKQSTQAQP
ncbi:conserved hypothetical protein [Hyella patelloides LEGE 07179]|uniref:Uncharacterized protein n=1 Tax=Hyella patelloides LEGE 07179 TaxID=945734 RepID=A0A563VRM2_9CYAN|nr:hypothetical protein [Hyella patelloides]VEP14020.1 conserved hypothetical protein [Hyella patelloides LEGE 07179]